jgi:ComEC/Rec2-related protein
VKIPIPNSKFLNKIRIKTQDPKIPRKISKYFNNETMKSLSNVSVIRVFLVFLLFLRIFIYFSTKTVIKVGDIVQISGRMTQEAKIGYSTARMILNDDLLVEVPLKMVKINFKTLKWQRIRVVGKVKPQELRITNYELRIENTKKIILATRIIIFPKDNLRMVLNFFDEMRDSMKNDFYRFFPRDEAEILSGVLLGDSKNVSRELLDAFYKTGTIHLFAASGMNLIIFCGFITQIFNCLVNKRKALIFSFIGAMFYVFLSGFSASILRAFVMFAFVNLAEISGRRAKGWWSLGVAAGILIFITPNIFFDLGFQLSVLATVGVMISSNFQIQIPNFQKRRFQNSRSQDSKKNLKFEIFNLKSKSENLNMFKIAKQEREILQNVHWVFEKIGKSIWSNFLVSICCFLMTAPVILLSFGKINLISPLANIFVMWMIEWIMMLGGFLIVINWVMKPLGLLMNILVFIIYPFLFVFKRVVLEFSKLDLGVINLNYGGTTIFLLVFCLTIWIGFVLKKSTKCEH